MWDADRQPPAPPRAFGKRLRGVAAVEFALLAIWFFTVFLGLMELARLIYVFNTLQEVTRRAAAMAINAPFMPAAQDAVRNAALFLDSTGTLMLGSPVTAAHVKIDYLSLSQEGTVLAVAPMSTLPSNAAANRINCLANPYGANCIRFVRVRICQPDAPQDCAAVPYRMLFSLVDLTAVTLPRSVTIVPAQTLGYVPGALPGY